MGEQGQVFLNKDAASPLLPAAGWPRARSPGPADSAALPAEAPGGKSRRLQGAGCGPRSLLLGQLTGPCRHRPGPKPLPGPQVPRGRGAAGARGKTQAGGSAPSLPAGFCSRLLLTGARPARHVKNCTQLSPLARLCALCPLLPWHQQAPSFTNVPSHVHPPPLLLLEREPHAARVFVFFTCTPSTSRSAQHTAQCPRGSSDGRAGRGIPRKREAAWRLPPVPFPPGLAGAAGATRAACVHGAARPADALGCRPRGASVRAVGGRAGPASGGIRRQV